MQIQAPELEMARTAVRMTRLARMRATNLKKLCLDLAATQGISPASIRRGHWTTAEMLDRTAGPPTEATWKRQQSLFDRLMPRTPAELATWRGLAKATKHPRRRR